MGRLYYLMGPSGAGKDSLLRLARERLAGSEVLFAHRYITRPPELDGENHVYLSPAEFERRVEQRLFALHWDSHGLRYGVGREIELWLTEGLDVVLNGSRAYLEVARARYPTLLPVSISVSPQVLRQRLEARGRESARQIDERLARATAVTLDAGPGLVEIANDGELEAAAEALVRLLRRE